MSTRAEPDLATELVADVKACRLPPPARRRRIREEADVSLRAMAKVLGVTAGALQRWEAGTVTPRRANAVKYGRLLHMLEEAVR